MEAVVFDNVTKQFSATGEMGQVVYYGVQNLSFSVDEGDMVAIVGPTGCGKSTTFNLLMGLMPPTSGEIRVNGINPYADFDAFKGHLGIVFQNDRLLPWRTAIENAAIGLEVLGVSKTERLDRAGEWLKRLGLAGYENKYPHELSGGMKQRVAIARAFVMDPRIILCDESFSALDEVTATRLRQEFMDLVRQGGKTGIFITHSIEEAIQMGRRILVFAKPGRVIREFEVPADLSAGEAVSLRQEILNIMQVAQPKGDS